jgi:copper chaperone CopZ
MEKHSLIINGMGSRHCVGVVKNIINTHEGADLDAIDIGKADISLDTSITSLQNLTNTIEKMGYTIEQ